MAKDTLTSLDVAPLRRGRFVLRAAHTPADVARLQRLRHLCFVEAAGRPALPGGIEADQFDAACQHVLIEDDQSSLVAGFRIMGFDDGSALGTSYSAESYDLAGLMELPVPMVELGRFCVDPDVTDPDVLRLAWAGLARIVDQAGAQYLFGCSSFQGTDPEPYADGFNLLATRHLGPADLRPGLRADEVFAFAANAQPARDRKGALSQIPSLLRTYLGMGGWVSNHAVVDRAMNTLHVFTALEIAAIPPARVQALRAVAND